ncbi:PH domain-containing protein [Plasmodiophora brassicae]|uniref:PH domain-containing protein n=1 Tax=Plasmodiophora brassicae TaxID=37360 RepID=A0A0G4IND8_PLABS|nr:hypothetical protein PBRA_005432 [Plasmodiophora brassicae]SPR01785.1 unnamed protein product [Plasmodiophora brassicae]
MLGGSTAAPVIRNPTKEGWLEKQSRILRVWKKRWVVLENSKLYTFRNEKEYANPTEVIDLSVFSSVKSSEDVTRRPHSFDVYSNEYGFSLCAPSANDKEAWIRAIGRDIVMARTNQWQDDVDAYGE